MIQNIVSSYQGENCDTRYWIIDFDAFQLVMNKNIYRMDDRYCWNLKKTSEGAVTYTSQHDI